MRRVVLTCLVGTGCACGLRTPLQLDAPPLILTPIQRSDVRDGRGRFREILVAVRDARSKSDPGDRNCEKLLWKMAQEPPTTGEPVHLGPPRIPLRILAVPGLLGDVIAPWVMPFAHGLARLEEQGYETGYLSVSGRASCEYNANLLGEAILDLELAADEKVLLVTYSKGTPDALEAIVRHSGVREKVSALLSVAGCVGGSPVADEAPAMLRLVFKNVPLIQGTFGDRGAIESVQRRTRQIWLNQNELPPAIHYFSLGAFTDRDRVSSILRSGYDTCARIDPRNDSHVLFYDQIIPGSTLLGFANADHWAVGLPFSKNMPVASAVFVTRNDYPRELLLEAAVRYIEEVLVASDKNRATEEAP